MKLKFDRSYILIAAIALCLIMAACSPSGTNSGDALTGAFTDKDLGIAMGAPLFKVRRSCPTEWCKFTGVASATSG